jgi:hypothetical protein
MTTTMTRSQTQIDSRGVCSPNAGGQAAFCADWEHRYVALEGGWGSGKTWAGARKLLTLHLYNAFDEHGQKTATPSAVIAPTYGNALDFALPAMLSACEDAGLTIDWNRSRSNLVLVGLGTRREPSVIMFRSADNPQRIAGWEVGAFWADEAARWKSDRHEPSNDPLLQIKGRLRHPRARLLQGLFTYTNEGDHTAIYEEFHRGDEDHALYRAATADNPAVGAFYQDQLRNLTPELKRQYLDGHAVSLRGLRVYSQFDPQRHVDDALALVPDRPLQLAVDFNLNPGMHAQLGQHFPELDLFTVVHEIHEPRLDVRGVATRLAALLSQLNFPVNLLEVFGDATGRSQWPGTSESCYGVLRQALHAAGIEHRLRVPRCNPPVTDRIDAFNSAMLDVRDEVHWRCHSRCVRLMEDLKRLRRDDDGRIDKSQPHLSHASDAESYRVHYLRPVRVMAQRTFGRVGV